MTPRGAGFTLIELTVATLISAIIMAGLGGLLLTTFNAQIKAMREARVQMAASVLSKSLERDIYEANHVVSPAVNSQSTMLEAYIGQMHSGGGTPWVSPTGAASFTWVYYCWKAADSSIYYYNQSYSVGTVPAPPACGSGSYVMKFGAPTLKIVAETLTSPNIFQRSPGANPNNIVQVSFTIQAIPQAGQPNPSLNIDLNLQSQYAGLPP